MIQVVKINKEKDRDPEWVPKNTSFKMSYSFRLLSANHLLCLQPGIHGSLPEQIKSNSFPERIILLLFKGLILVFFKASTDQKTTIKGNICFVSLVSLPGVYQRTLHLVLPQMTLLPGRHLYSVPPTPLWSWDSLETNESQHGKEHWPKSEPQEGRIENHSHRVTGSVALLWGA